MKATGIITEYNPFHNGHIHHIREASIAGKSDCIISVMSGSFVQRGEPAIIDKYSRAKASLSNGVDLVVELPVIYSLGSAEIFSEAAVKILAALKVDNIVFGSECDDIELLRTISKVVLTEPGEYKETLKGELSKGTSFAKARQTAIESVLHKDLSHIFSSNNILGIEYIKAIDRYNFPITPLTIKRKGMSYNDSNLNNHRDVQFASATALRQLLSESMKSEKNPPFSLSSWCAGQFLQCDKFDKISHNIKKFIPEDMFSSLADNFSKSTPVVCDDFSNILNHTLLRIFYECGNDKSSVADRLTRFFDISYDLGCKIYSEFTGHDSFLSFAHKLKSKQYALSRITRCLFHIILNITDEDYALRDNLLPPYIRILGFTKKGQLYLSEIKKDMETTLITKVAAHKAIYLKDLYATHLYNQIVFEKYNYIIPDEFHQKILRDI